MQRIFRYGFNKIYTICNALRGVKIGKGSLIHCRSELRNKRNISLGERAIFYKNLTIYLGKKGTFSIGSDSHIAPYAYFLVENQRLTIGNDVAIGPFCSFFCSSNSYSKEKTLFRDNYDKADINIGNNVFIGAQSVIMPGAVIGDNSIIAANSVVNDKLEGGWIYGGSPCKPIKKLSEDD